MSRRRLLMLCMQSSGGTKSSWYTIGSVDSTAEYAFSIVLSGRTYIYASEYPFYFSEDETGFYIIFAINKTTRNGTNYLPSGTSVTIDGIACRKELTKRTVSVVSETDIYVWEG